MLHLRVISPGERTDAVVQVLLDAAGATHVTVSPGAAVQPRGDLVQADVAREATDDVLAALCDIGVDRSGGITLEVIDTALSDAADAAEEAAPGLGTDAVVWDEVIARTGADSRLSVGFQAFLTIACLLAAIGAIENPPVTVVGAMVLGPEFAPLVSRSPPRRPAARRSPSGPCSGAVTWSAGARSRSPSGSRSRCS